MINSCFPHFLGSPGGSASTRRCRCGYDWHPDPPSCDQTYHVMMCCPLHARARRSMLRTASAASAGHAFLSLSPSLQYETLLYGSEELALEQSLKVQRAVELYTHAVNGRMVSEEEDS